MQHRNFFGLVLGLSTLAAVAPASGHHAFAVQFDAEKPVTAQGVVNTRWKTRTP